LTKSGSKTVASDPDPPKDSHSQLIAIASPLFTSLSSHSQLRSRNLGSAPQGGFPTELTSDEEMERDPGKWRRIIVLSERVYVIKYENKQKEWHPATKPYL
jgi:hypothetical protein